MKSFLRSDKVKWLFVLAIGMAVPSYINLVMALGHRIPQPDLLLDFTKGVLWAVFLGMTIFVWPVSAQDKKVLLWIWIVKCFVMFGPMLYYESHYQIDSFKYFYVAHFPMSEWYSRGIVLGGVIIVFIAQMHIWLYLDSFHAVKATFSMVGLIGIYIFYRSAVLVLQKENRKILYLLAFFPSILFWSSILGKEPLFLFGMAIYCYGAVKYARQRSFVAVMILLLGLALETAIRFWMICILLAPFFLLLISTIKKRSRSYVPYMALIIVFLILISWKEMLNFLKIHSVQGLVHDANLLYAGFATGGSSVDNNSSTLAQNAVKYHNIKEVIFFLPQGIFTALFRPFPGEVHNPFGLLAGLEDVFMFLLFCLAVLRTRVKELADPIIMWAIAVIVIWALMYAFISYNLGTVFRYRFQILPLFLLLLMYLSRKRTV